MFKRKFSWWDMIGISAATVLTRDNAFAGFIFLGVWTIVGNMISGRSDD